MDPEELKRDLAFFQEVIEEDGAIVVAVSKAMGPTVERLSELMDRYHALGPIELGFMRVLANRAARNFTTFVERIDAKADLVGNRQSYYKGAIVNELTMLLVGVGMSQLLIELQKIEDNQEALLAVAGGTKRWQDSTEPTTEEAS